jgi:hypothetical protein
VFCLHPHQDRFVVPADAVYRNERAGSVNAWSHCPSLMDDPELRRRLADAALAARARLATWEQANARMAAALQAIASA